MDVMMDDVGHGSFFLAEKTCRIEKDSENADKIRLS